MSSYKRLFKDVVDQDDCEEQNITDNLNEDEIRQKRTWNRITDHDRQKLEISVSFGLSGNSACKIVKMGSCNAARILKEQ